MNREELSELAAGYALGALEGEERARFEALLDAGDRDAHAALRDFAATLAAVGASTAEAPPPRIKAELLARIERESTTAPVRPAVSVHPRRSAFWPGVVSGAVAAGLVALVVGWLTASEYAQRLDTLERGAAGLRVELENQKALLELLRDPETQVVALSGVGPGTAARGRMMWLAHAGGYFVAAGLPASPAGKAYQLWAIAGANAPVSGGVFTVDGRGAVRLIVPQLPGVTRVDAFAVTLEPAGGLPAPSGEMYLLGKS
jgi:anti-sigma-K factor RskA